MIDHVGEKPAPGNLLVIQAFVNTLDVETGRDELKNRDALAEWLRAHNLLARSVRATDADVRKAATLREAIRELLYANATGEEPGRAAFEAINRQARDAEFSVVFASSGAAKIMPRASGVDGALGSIIAIVHEAMADRSWQRLKACRASTCLFAFYDHSKNQLGAWCTMKVCGNREKVRTFRHRHAGA